METVKKLRCSPDSVLQSAFKRKPAGDYLKSLPESEFKYEGASADAILEALEKKTKPKSNEIAAFTKLCTLKQGDMPLSEFMREAKRLAELCNYPNDQIC